MSESLCVRSSSPFSPLSLCSCIGRVFLFASEMLFYVVAINPLAANPDMKSKQTAITMQFKLIHASSIVLPIMMWCFLLGNIANAHPHHHHSERSPHGVIDGMLHPLTGADHVLAVAIVGLLATRVGGDVRFRLPIAYCIGIAIGVTLGYQTRFTFSGDVGYPLLLLVLSSLLLTRRFDTVLPVGGLLAGLLHGHLHGTVVQPSMGAFAYFGGMILMTAMLIAGGVAAGCLIKQFNREQALLVTTTSMLWLIGIWSLVQIR
ncbi:HupE/UreJ family protein [Gimesia maris]|uniref:HupE/UreJ family protein n=1 Tax=Gimesia maris TaxID=122 RepID=UPI003A93B82C